MEKDRYKQFKKESNSRSPKKDSERQRLSMKQLLKRFTLIREKKEPNPIKAS